MKDFKYLIAYLAPLAAFLGLKYGGAWSPGAVYVGFVMIPLLELVLPKSTENLTEEVEQEKKQLLFFDILLYLNVPILYGLLWMYFNNIFSGGFSTGELVGMTVSMGVILGSIGINVAHELGHRKSRFDQLMAQLLLLPNLYMHFTIEHNLGHHKHVATLQDPASSRKGEPLYAFWVRSVSGVYVNAWKIQSRQLEQQGKAFVSVANKMLIFQLIQLAWLLTIGWWFGWMVAAFAAIIAVIGFLQLEVVNYIEHYGLQRQQLPSGRYEKVGPQHSWNSDHELGRIFLYELTRHSDHHFKASRKYQILRHFDESPQLPFGYPGSMLLSLIPPLWFKVMDKRLEKVN